MDRETSRVRTSGQDPTTRSCPAIGNLCISLLQYVREAISGHGSIVGAISDGLKPLWLYIDTLVEGPTLLQGCLLPHR